MLIVPSTETKPRCMCSIRIPTAVGATTTSFIATVGAPAPGSYKLMEIVCQHDERAQASDLKGTLGLPIRPPPVPTVGSHLLPREGIISTCTFNLKIPSLRQLAIMSACEQENEYLSSPPLLPLFLLKISPSIALWPSCNRQIGPVSTLFRWYARRDIWLGKESPDDLAPKPADSLFDTARRPVNTEDDPVMSFYELVSLLEDFEIIPQKMRRGDLQKLYHLACTAPKHGMFDLPPAHACLPATTCLRAEADSLTFHACFYQGI